MMLPDDFITMSGIVIGDHTWVGPAILIAIAGIVLVLLLNHRRLAVLSLATAFRVAGWLLITACLVNPLWSSARPRQGANLFAVVVDDSRSLTVQTNDGVARSERLSQLLSEGEREETRGWLRRLDELFEVRRYTLSDHLQRTPRLDPMEFNGLSSRLESGLTQLAQRFQEQPLAGVLLFTDGNATDTSPSLTGLAPVYPVVIHDEAELPPDLSVRRVSTSQSAFDDAPVTIQVQLETTGVTAGTVRTALVDADGRLLDSHKQAAADETPVRFQVRPDTAGTVFFEIHAELLDEDGGRITEATRINNTRLAAVDRGSKPRRVLYVAGRPNWEFKFLRRAVETDPQTELVGLIRIARKEAKFEFRGRSGERSNALFRGFDADEQEVAEEYDEPVLVRLGTKNDDELLTGFPEQAADLFRYDALILDDIEADFFTADQQQLIRDFVARRGGGLLMLGGQESFRRGEYDRTPVGELLPVDLRQPAARARGGLRLTLTREGWLQPWVRLRADEEAEHVRLQDMPAFQTLNPALRIRPGAQVMATVTDDAGETWPALIVQRFGRGRSGALCIGDLWRWRLHEARLQETSPAVAVPRNVQDGSPWETTPEEDRGNYSRAARQMVRWLVSDVPRRLTVSASPSPSDGVHTWRLSATVRGPDFEPREDADVVFSVRHADGSPRELTGRPANDEVGRYDALLAAGEGGPWNCEVTATLQDPDAEPEVLIADHGWASQPDQQEMASVQVNTPWLESLAASTGGRVVRSNELDHFVEKLQTTDAPVMEVLSWPLWHQWSVFLVALACFVCDWTIRRRLGYP